ncbi:serine/threonine protein kinase [Gordonia oryzae]|uniref:Serine/threonine protein kinase n=2 Tax=Gordonia oryzae TaxID=2487349 RepID=A0A3N4GY96_9ACTN|nr:serine/threonine protein kinase [Gordonia oryzae]
MVAGYHLSGPVRTDALGQVYIADRLGSGRVLMRLLAVDPNAVGFRSSFSAQAHAVQGLVHPGLGGLLQYGEESGRTWFTSRFVDGHLLTADRRADSDALAIAGQVADVLDHAHRRGIVHGDLAPGEILLPGAAGPDPTDGTVAILDVGTLALSGRPVLNPLSGSPEFTAPEVIAGHPAGPASDQYSLACILYQMMVGTTPFASSSPTEILGGHLHRQAPPISARRPDLAMLDVAFGHALDKDPARRYPDCRAFVGTVATLASRTAAQHQPSAPEIPPSSFRGRSHTPAPDTIAPVVTPEPPAHPRPVDTSSENPAQAPVRQLPVPDRIPAPHPPSPATLPATTVPPGADTPDAPTEAEPSPDATAPPTVVPADTGSSPLGLGEPTSNSHSGQTVTPDTPMPTGARVAPSSFGDPPTVMVAGAPAGSSSPESGTPPQTGTAHLGSPDTLPPMDLPADLPGRGARLRRRVLVSALGLAAVAVIAVIAVAATWFVVGREPSLTQVTTSSISTDNNATCAIRDAQLYCWGSNTNGVLGNGTTTDSSAPVKVNGLGKVTSVDLGWTSACAIADGALYCWGGNAQGQLGNGTTNASLNPTKVDSLHNVTSVTVGADVTLVGDAITSLTTTCAVADGGTYCWGANHDGQIGDGTTTDRPSPTRVKNIGDVVSATTDSAQTCAVTRPGDVYCWGSNERGQLGDGTLDNRVAPVRIGGVSHVTDIATSVNSTCAVSDGSLWCWGNNTYEQTGDADRRTTRVPTKVAGLTDVSSVALGSQTTCAVAGAAAYCWGINSANSINSDPRGYFATPAKITGIDGSVTEVTTASSVSCARTDHKTFCWGSNSKGQLGLGSTGYVDGPTEVSF